LNAQSLLTPLTTVPCSLGSTRVFTAPGGPGTPVLVLPGSVLSTATLLDTVRVLSEERPVLIADPPGQPGLSDGARPLVERLSAYGGWLDEVLPRVTDRPVLVLGHGVGAAVALSATPGPLVAGLLLVNPGGLTPATGGTALGAALVRWRFHPGARTSSTLLRALCGPGAAEPRDATMLEWTTLVGRSCRALNALPPRPLRAEAFRRWKGTPVSVATGSHDPFFSPDLLHSPSLLFLDASVHTVRGAGHLALRERPDQVRDLLRGLPGSA
jgi:pimeloyl-ACP methyl ester carboxylesterase